MPVLLLRLPKIDDDTSDRPRQCPYCSSQILQRWGRVTKPVIDKQELTAGIHRYRCWECKRTFRDYPQGIDRSAHTLGIRRLAALIWALGLSFRDIVEVFEKLGVTLSHSMIWREKQELASQVNGHRFDSTQRYTIDQQYIHQVSSKFGVVVALDLGDGNYTILGTLNEHNPISVKSWLQPLVRQTGIKILTLGTFTLDYLNTFDQERLNPLPF